MQWCTKMEKELSDECLFSSQETDGEETDVELETETCEALSGTSKKVKVATHEAS